MQDAAIGVVVPAHNEAPSLRALIGELTAALAGQDRTWEIVVVDDGSTDETPALLAALASGEPRVRPVTLPCRQGKAAALAAGFAATDADTVVTLDADLQDDPADLPRFLAALNEGADLVCGWKQPRRDPWHRRVSSRLFNWIGSRVLGPRLHDHNCGFKAYRRAVLEAIGMYGDLHRFATFLAHDLGFRVTEIPVHHRPREFGRSRYGIERIWRFGFDLLTVALLACRNRRIFGAFAAVGMPLVIAGLLLCALMLCIPDERALAHTPRFLVGILAFLAGVQIVAAGLIGELILSIWRGRPAEAARRDLLADFPGRPRSEGELDAWRAGLGVATCAERPRRPRLLVILRHFSLFFLARYHARPLHFFGAVGGLTAFAGFVLGLGVKLSAIAGVRRYFLMELALGVAVAGIQLFVTGLLGELLAYVRNAPARKDRV